MLVINANYSQQKSFMGEILIECCLSELKRNLLTIELIPEAQIYAQLISLLCIF